VLHDNGKNVSRIHQQEQTTTLDKIVEKSRELLPIALPHGSLARLDGTTGQNMLAAARRTTGWDRL